MPEDPLRPATHRLVRAIDAMSDEEWAAPSLLPAWSRSHLVAHLTLNAEALGRAVAAVTEGRRLAMYPSQEARDGDIVALAAERPSALRDRMLGSTTILADALAALPDSARDVAIERVEGGATFAAGAVHGLRWREVEVHHVDLGLGRSPADWSEEFAEQMLDAMAARRSAGPGQPGQPVQPGFTVAAADLGRTWAVGDPQGGPTVTGAAGALGWWLSGRGSGEGLTSDDGVLPGTEAW